MTLHNKSRLLSIALLAIVSGIAAPSSARAAQVSAALSSHEAYVGMPITAYVEITNAKNHAEPELPNIDGAEIKSSGAASRSSQTTIINGHRSERTSVTYAWQITPRRPGEFVVPSIEVKVDGRTVTTRPMRFVTNKSETGDLMFVEVGGAQEKIYVGQPMRLTLTVWLKPYRDSRHDITLSEANMWQLIASRNSNWGAFGPRLQELAENRQRIRGKQELRKDNEGVERNYYRYDIDATIYPKRPGQVDVGDVQVVANYPTGLSRSRSFFSMGDLAIDGTRPIAANATVAPIEVLPVPTEGRPADYRGTVGRYEIVAQATPTSVKAGDPITLHIGIRGDGPMELVQAPPLADLPELTKNFKVPDESLAGHVKDDVKVFSVSIRPREQGITEIPSIPLTFFDPASEKFETVRSEPIAIQVAKADTLSLSAIVGQATGGGEGREDAADVEPLVLDNHRGADVLSKHAPTSLWSYALWMLFAPLTYLFAFGYKHGGDIAARIGGTRFAARRRAHQALSTATSPHAIAAAVLQYIAYLFKRPHASFTRDEAIRQLGEHGQTDDIYRVDRLLAACEANSYAADTQADVDALIDEAAECIDLLSAHWSDSTRRDARSQSSDAKPRFRHRAKSAAAAMCIVATAVMFAPANVANAGELSTTQALEILAEADEAYSTGQTAANPADAKEAFATAAQKYQTLVDDGAHNGQLYFNLGNAYLQQGDAARALANYERSSHLSPGNSAVERNRQHACEILGIAAPEPQGFVENATTYFAGLSPRTLITGSLVTWFAMWAAIIGLLFAKHRALRYTASIAGISAIAFGIAAGYQWSNIPTHDRGIVVVESTMLLEGNGDSFAAKTGHPLAVGGQFELVEQRDDWLRVKLASGETGWISADKAEVIRSTNKASADGR